jgi:hypothetical protein
VVEEEKSDAAEVEKDTKDEIVNGSEEAKVEVNEKKPVEEKTEEKEEKPEVKIEQKSTSVPPTKVDEESLEENKENNESSAKSIGSNSPRSTDECLKTVTEGNFLKNDLNESAELFKEKVNHFKSLGLLTHKAADEAKLAKIKRKEELALQMAQQQQRKAKHRDSSHDQQNQSNKTSGTLKTIIKLPKTDKEKRKSRMPLKMTFQKKSRDKDSNGSSNSSADSFYTIQNEARNLFKNSNYSLIN